MAVVSFLLTTISAAFYFISNFFGGGSYVPKPLVEYNNVKYPFCVVGAGISGLNVATLLQNKGHLVHVFEKKGTVGGKMITYREGDEIQVEMGPLLFSQGQLALMKKIKEHQLTVTPFNESDVGFIDPTSGKVFPPPSFTTEQISHLRSVLTRYAFHYSQYEKDLDLGYTNASPDLFVSIADWLDSRNLTALKPLFTLAITVEGYGALDELPSLYALKFVSPQFVAGIGNFVGSLNSIGEGLDVLANKMASPLTIFLNTEVTRISRKGDYPTVVFGDENSGGYNTQKCNAVILAFPPLLLNLEKVIVDLNEDEKNILANVKVHRYTSAAHQIPSFERSLYYDPNAKGAGEVVALVRQSSKSINNIYSSYSWIRGDFNSGPTAMDLLKIENNLEKFVKKVNRNSTTFYGTTLEYFPHVGTNALKSGFYKKFNSIQGTGGLFYATTLLSFETMESALKMTEDFVEKYF